MAYGIETYTATGKLQLSIDRRVAKILSVTSYGTGGIHGPLGTGPKTFNVTVPLAKATGTTVLIVMDFCIYTLVAMQDGYITMHTPSGLLSSPPMTLILVEF